VEGCAGGRARTLNLQCAGRHVDKLGLSDGTALELKALLESLRAPMHTGAGGGGGGAPAPAPAPPAPVKVCDAHKSRTYMHVSSSSYGMPPSTSRTYIACTISCFVWIHMDPKPTCIRFI
jgi:hypothetical protein